MSIVRPAALVAVLAVALAGIASPVRAADPLTAEQLMQRLAETRASRVGFVDRKYLSSLDRPLVSSGELVFTAPARLEKRTVEPRPETLIVDGDTVTIERNGSRRSISLAAYPEIAALTDSIRATLSGDLVTLRRDYRVVVDGTAAQWKLTLLPSDAKIAQIVSRVTIGGRDNLIDTIEVLQADGNRAVTTIGPLAQPAAGARP